MDKIVNLGDISIGKGQPCFLVAEIGLNHNGDLQIAKQLMQLAASSGWNAVKFQKRTPELCVPEAHRNVLRETPWGLITYMEYRYKVEFGHDEYKAIDDYAKELGVNWFASPWDTESVDFLEQFNPICHKIPSACLTDIKLLEILRTTNRPIMVSTGMSTLDEISAAVEVLDRDNLVLLHCNSSYPAEVEEIDLRTMQTLEKEFDAPVGYSGHERGLQVSLAAVALGACVIERHITLDRTMWGSDQSASLEPGGFQRLARDIRIIEKALGTGIKKVWPSELPIRERLRKH